MMIINHQGLVRKTSFFAHLIGITQSINTCNKPRPNNFIFQLSKEEKDEVVTNCDHLSRLIYLGGLNKLFYLH